MMVGEEAMERRDLIVELCREAGDTRLEAEAVEDWEADHACCCTLHVEKAARGDAGTLHNIRACMGLPLPR